MSTRSSAGASGVRPLDTLQHGDTNGVPTRSSAAGAQQGTSITGICEKCSTVSRGACLHAALRQGFSRRQHSHIKLGRVQRQRHCLSKTHTAGLEPIVVKQPPLTDGAAPGLLGAHPLDLALGLHLGRVVPGLRQEAEQQGRRRELVGIAHVQPGPSGGLKKCHPVNTSACGLHSLCHHCGSPWRSRRTRR